VPRRKGSRAAGGSGIGLAVVKGLAEAMGGSAIARPSTLGGLEVIVRLPIEYEPKATDSTEASRSTDSAAPTEPSRPSASASASARRRILIGPE
jgi:hypothetical protein